MSNPLRALLLALAAAPLLSASPSASSADERPNILLLWADDQRADTLGAWGNDVIRTPNIDSLVERGYSFRRTYCFGSPHGAVCIPSRAMLHTGRHWPTVDLGDFGGRPTLGSSLREAGYATFATGKWHNGREPLAAGFEEARAVYLGGMSDHNHVPGHDVLDGTFHQRGDLGGHSSEIFADAAVEFLQRRGGDDRPFFCYVSFTAPHDPRDPPPGYSEEYYERRPPLPPNFLPQHPFDNGQLVTRDEKLGAWPRTAEMVSEQLAEYYGLITHLDEQVGRILLALEATGRAENTLVVYAADHGLAVGSHGLLGKQSLYEHSMRAPLVIAGPRVPHGETHALTYLHDLFPTLLCYAGLEPPADTHTLDLAPLWRGEVPRLRETLFTTYGKLMRAVQDGRWKLIRYPAVDYTQLFDLHNDPHELHNLAGEPEHVVRVARLRGEIERWQRDLDDGQPWRVAEPEPLAKDLTGREREPDRWQPEWIVEKYFRD